MPPAADALKTLIARTAGGDADALAALYGRFGPAVHALAYRLTRSADEADDVLQDVFVGLPEALRRYEHRGRFDAWLGRVAARVALARLRHDRRFLPLAEPADGAPRDAARAGDALAVAPAVAPALDAAVHARLALARALASLPEAGREVYRLRELEGHSHEEIARRLHITRNASEVRFHRAVRQLRQHLGEV